MECGKGMRSEPLPRQRAASYARTEKPCIVQSLSPSKEADDSTNTVIREVSSTPTDQQSAVPSDASFIHGWQEEKAMAEYGPV